MGEIDAERRALAQYLSGRHHAILDAWRNAIKRDPALTSGDSLPRLQLFDHIPGLLSTFERELHSSRTDEAVSANNAAQESAAAHGLQRWQQGYDLREVTRELGKLNECVVAELDVYTTANPQTSHAVIAAARRIWAALCSTGIEESVGQYFQLQQQEAAGQVKDLESALAEIKEIEQERADLWRQAAHDLRGNLGVVANVTVGLTHGGIRESTRDDFVRILMRNVTTLHHLLDDVTSLARLQAGREQRQIEALDITPILQQLCEGIRPLAQQRHLFLRSDGPLGFAADGDAVKIRRIAQNLILNAVKFTREGGITVSWGDSGAHDSKRWELCVTDTGPGFHSDSGKPLAQALEDASEVAVGGPPGETPAGRTEAGRAEAGRVEAGRVDASGAEAGGAGSGRTQAGGADAGSADSGRGEVGGARAGGAKAGRAVRDETGEGIGLSIVKRLCELLDATIEVKSVSNVGTTFRILFPRKYTQ
jgi:signal transduction histidine kinase